MPRFFRYVLRYDTGMAPCPQDGLLSLCTCKPAIRRAARVGDLVAGFAPSPAPHGVMTYAARVREVLSWPSYAERYPDRTRRDAVYAFPPGGEGVALDPGYHSAPADRRKDLSADVLIFDPGETWYFGRRPQPLPRRLMWSAIGGRGSRGGRGHRVDAFDPDDPAGPLAWLRRSFAPGLEGPTAPRGSCGATPAGRLA